jgi:hypothetical protein
MRNIIKKNSVKEIAVIVIMLIVIFSGYALFYNSAFSGYDAKGAHIWLSAGTVVFVNNWLKEGALNLKFINYSYPDSIEFNNLAERKAYVSYPPGALLPPYILAKLLHKTEIQVHFIKQFLKIKFLLDTVLVCLVAYSILRWTMRLRQRKTAALASAVLALSWMCLPVNLYYLRNIYYTDQSIISIVLLFILLELYDSYFTEETQKAFLRYVYLVLKGAVSLYGVLTDWYFLFVLLVSWVVKIVPLFKTKNAARNITVSSLVYALPVLSGLTLFVLQISTIPNFKEVIMDKLKYRIFPVSHDYWAGGNLIDAVLKWLSGNYSFGFVLLVCVIVFSFYVVVKNRGNAPFFGKYKALFGMTAVVYIPPVLHALVLRQHSAVHEFFVLKFALPVILGPVVLGCLIFALLGLELKTMSGANFVIHVERGNDVRKLGVPVLYFCVMISVLIMSTLGADTSYFWEHTELLSPVSYDRENLIRDNYSFNDVYFSFTESIDFDPLKANPRFLARSNKLIYKIGSVSDINQKFPNLNPNARILLMVNKNDSDKPAWILENERNAIQDAGLLFSDGQYDVYEIPREPDK